MIFQRHAGIFAAGHGSRLQSLFPNTIKPMVPVAGRPLIEWTARLLISAGVEDITVLLNSSGKPAKEHLKKTFPSTRFIFISRDTASSYESFSLLSQLMAMKTENFILSTVDAFYPPQDLKKFIEQAQNYSLPATLAVTDRIEDEKPLWTDLDSDGVIKRMGPACKDHKFATSGLYFFTAALAARMPEAEKFTALRQYLTGLVESGERIGSVPMNDGVDVDDADDIALAENFVRTYFKETSC